MSHKKKVHSKAKHHEGHSGGEMPRLGRVEPMAHEKGSKGTLKSMKHHKMGRGK